MIKIVYVCSSCGYEPGKWYGKCPECGNWNTFEEVPVLSKKERSIAQDVSVPHKLSEISLQAVPRLSSGFEEVDRVLGGSPEQNNVGIVPGSVILLSGDPGVGKSTLLLQIALNMANSRLQRSDSNKQANNTQSDISHVLYVAGEESEQQVKMRATRIAESDTLANAEFQVLATTDIDHAHAIIERQKPSLVIVDSIQTMSSANASGFAGSIPQIRYCTSELVRLAKKYHIPIFIVGHVTKEGMVAGPMVLSHMVDTVLYLEGEQVSGTRILRSHKNRFGDTSEVGIFIMEARGLVQVTSADYFMDKNNATVPGSCITVVMEGTRPILVEIQALCTPSMLPFSRRVASGIDSRRLELLLAVIQKHAKIPLDKTDVFVNVVGGLRITETGVDLACALALVSSFKNKPLGICAAISEVGLLGELKKVVNLKNRIKEAHKFGIKEVVSADTARFLRNVIEKIV